MGLKLYLKAPDLLVPTSIWRLYRRIIHPIRTYRWYKKWYDRPEVGEFVIDCRGKTLMVVRRGADPDVLFLEDGSTASWMSCCEHLHETHCTCRGTGIYTDWRKKGRRDDKTY